jgi:ADP-heptose:LPS heptosyltransferase
VAVAQRPLLVALRPLGLGDLLTVVPALRALAAASPEHERALAAPRELAPLALLSGAIDRVVDTKPLVPLPRQLDRPDVAVDLHGRGPASHRVLLSARPRRLLAFANRDIPESRGMPEWRADEHEVRRWCRLLAEHDLPARRVALAHMDRNPDPGLHAELAERGAFVMYDGAGKVKHHPDSLLIDLVAWMAEAGHAASVLLGGDVGRRGELRAYGGGPGIAHLFAVLVPRLRRALGAGRGPIVKLRALLALPPRRQRAAAGAS